MQQTAQIDVDHAVPLVGPRGLEGSAEHHTGIGHDEIDPAELRGDGTRGGVNSAPGQQLVVYRAALSSTSEQTLALLGSLTADQPAQDLEV